MRARIERDYGASPLHLLGGIAWLALTAWVAIELFETPQPRNLAVWLIGAIVAHDLIAVPVYSALDRVVRGRTPPERRVPWVNHVRVPVILGGLVFLVYFPAILDLSPGTYIGVFGAPRPDYLPRYLIFLAVLFGGSAAVYAVRSIRRARGGRTSGAHAPTGS